MIRVQRPQSIVEQVTAILRQRMHDQLYPPGGRLPSESELAAELGVSRATVRTVLTKFATEGLILRKQGDGTYVNERIRDVDTRYGGIWDFSRLIKANGHHPTIRTVQLETRPATVQEAIPLGIQQGEKVLSLQRLFLAGDRPAIYACNVLPIRWIITHPADSQIPIHEFLRVYCHQEIVYAVSYIEAAPVEEELKNYLEREAGSPILKLVETFYNQDNEPLVYGVSYYDQTVLRLRLVQAWG